MNGVEGASSGLFQLGEGPGRGLLQILWRVNVPLTALLVPMIVCGEAGELHDRGRLQIWAADGL